MMPGGRSKLRHYKEEPEGAACAANKGLHPD